MAAKIPCRVSVVKSVGALGALLLSASCGLVNGKDQAGMDFVGSEPLALDVAKDHRARVEVPPLNLQDGLSLLEFVQVVQTHNTSLRTAENDFGIATARLNREGGIFEPVVFGKAEIARIRDPLSENDIMLGQQPDPFPTDNQEFELGVRRLLPKGGTLSLTARLNRIQEGEATENSYESFVGVTYNQPLARGGGEEYVNAGIRSAQLDVDIAELSKLDRANAVGAQAGLLYLDGLQAQFSVDNIGERVAVLRDLLKSSEGLISEGRLPSSASVEIENAIDQTRALHSERAQSLKQYKRELLTLVGQRSQGQAGFRFSGSGLPNSPKLPCASSVCVARALDARTDVQAQRLKEDQADIEIQRAENEARPQTDLFLEVGFSANETTAGNSLALDSLADNPTARIGLRFELPLRGNQSAQASIDEAQLQLENEQLRSEELELNIENEILARRDAVLATGEQMVTWSQIARRSQRQMTQQREQFEQGRSTLLEVLRAQEHALNARSTAFEARVTHAKALILLNASQGALSSIQSGAQLFKSH